jgi:hypothetical protein
MPSSKKIKSQRKEDLRKRNLGVGIGKIDVDEVEKSTNKKITFDDDFVASDYESDDENDAANNEDEDEDERDQDSDEESSDDEVEQVSASTAKQEAMEMRAAERKTRKEETALSHKRKRKTKAKEKEIQVMAMPEMSDSEDDDLDDDMLELIDSERKAESKLKKLRKKAEGSLTKNLGKHTTFVAEDDDPSSRLGSIDAPIAADHNIDVVVLPGLRSEDAVTDDNGDAASGSSGYIGARDKQIVSLSSNIGTKPSETANLLCRGRSTLARNATDIESGFEVKRSRKMNYGLSRGKPLGGFIRKKRR